MTNIEKQVTDLETSKQMQEAGIKYETVWVWAKDTHKDKWVLCLKDKIHLFIFSYEKCKLIPAFTAGEMIDMLFSFENYVVIETYQSSIRKNDGFYEVSIREKEGYEENNEIVHSMKSFRDGVLKQALAELCLWCRKEGYL